MTDTVLVAGLDARSLILEAPLLQRERHIVEERGTARELLQDLPRLEPRLVVLGPRLPDLSLPETVRKIRVSPVMRQVSILALLPADEPADTDGRAAEAGANAILRRPVDQLQLETWLAKLLVVPRRVQARVAVQGRVAGAARPAETGAFYGITRNISLNGMLLASPIELGGRPDLDLEFTIPGLGARVTALGRVVREAADVEWPYLGYGVEFLVLPPETQQALHQFVEATANPQPSEVTQAIHSTLRRDDWVYEILEPVQHGGIWYAEVRRAPCDVWRPGTAGPFYVVEGDTRDAALHDAREFVVQYRHGVN